eukprot:982407-Amphidinium_carterae.2
MVLTSAVLGAQVVKQARLEEVRFAHEFHLYDKVPRQCSEGKPFITVKWVDVNKGDAQQAMVTRELKSWGSGMSGAFAATLPSIGSTQFGV